MAIKDIMSKEIYKYKKFNTEFSLPYRVYYPAGYSSDTEKKFPLLFFLHGHGECGTDNEKQLGVLGKPNILLEQVAEDNKCIILAPQCPCEPLDHEWVAINHRWHLCSREKLPKKPTTALAASTELLRSFIKKNRVDTSRVYIAGISMGGYGSWEMITRHPKLFAAAIILCGAGFPSYAARLKNISIWAFHGLKDGTVLPSGTKDMESALISVGGNIKATYFENIGHDVWDAAFSTEGLTEWLYSKSK